MGLKERKEREKEKRRDEIINAGSKIFLKKGFMGATMNEIARECELSKGTLYLYFNSKEHLFFSIVLIALTEMYNLMKNSQEELEDPLERMTMIGNAYETFYDRYPEYFRILARMLDMEFDFNVKNFELGLSIQEKNNEIWELMTKIIVDGIGSGIFKADTDPVEICLSLYATSNMIIQLMDHAKRNRTKLEKIGNGMEHSKMKDIFFEEHYFRKTLHNCSGRIVMSIMNNPSRLATKEKKP